MSGDWNPGEASDTGRTDEEHEGEIVDKMEDSRTKVVVGTSILVSSCLRKWEENLPKHDMIGMKRLP